MEGRDWTEHQLGVSVHYVDAQGEQHAALVARMPGVDGLAGLIVFALPSGAPRPMFDVPYDKLGAPETWHMRGDRDDRVPPPEVPGPRAQGGRP
jgi:hypothetical protein